MNQEVHDYLEYLIKERKIKHFEDLKLHQKRWLLGKILLESGEPILFLTETDCHKRLIHNLISYYNNNNSILDIFSDIEDSAIKYHEETMRDYFDQVRISFFGAYPRSRCNDYGARRGE